MKPRVGIVIGLVSGVLVGAAQEIVQVDFRNYIPGVLDAPVFYPDGVQRLAYIGSGYREPVAQLYYGKASSESSFTAAGGGVCLFQGGTNAGYWVPKLAALPDVRLGERIWLQVRAWEMTLGVPDPIIESQGASEVLSLVVTNPVMTLIGLESFRLRPEELWCQVHAGQLVVSWQHRGADSYELQSTEDVAATNSWVTIFTSTTEPVNSTLSITNPIVGVQRFYRLKRWP